MDFTNLLASYSPALTWIGPVVLAAVIYLAFKQRIDFWRMDLWYRFPFIGGVARMAKKGETGKLPGWRHSEETLCADYKKFVHVYNRANFSNRLEYLKKAGDAGRRPLPSWVLLFLGVLVLAEGLGFSYLLGTWLAREGSADTHEILMLAISAVIAGIMVWVTHTAGHQFYRTSLIRSCRKHWQESEKKGESFGGQDVSLMDDQRKDDHLPQHLQRVNRVGTTGSYGWMVGVVVIVAVFAIFMTWMRWEMLKHELTQETTLSTPAGAGNPFGGSDLPSEVLESQAEADNAAVTDGNKSKENEGLAAFLLLAGIFVVTQAVGVSAGYKWGFAGRESAEAYRETEGFATYEAYEKRYKVLMDLVESRLSALQQKMKNYGTVDVNSRNTFLNYLTEDDRRTRGYQGAVDAPITARPAQSTPAMSPSASQPIHVLPLSETAVHEVKTQSADVGISFEGALASADGIQDKAAKKLFLQSLPGDIQLRIRDTYAQRKKAEEEAAAKPAVAASEWDDVI